MFGEIEWTTLNILSIGLFVPNMSLKIGLFAKIFTLPCDVSVNLAGFFISFTGPKLYSSYSVQLCRIGRWRKKIPFSIISMSIFPSCFCWKNCCFVFISSWVSKIMGVWDMGSLLSQENCSSISCDCLLESDFYQNPNFCRYLCKFIHKCLISWMRFETYCVCFIVSCSIPVSSNSKIP